MLGALAIAAFPASAAKLEKASPNPDFVSYLKQLEIGTAGLGLETEGRSHGHIPGPVDLSHTVGKQVIDQRRLTALPSSYDLRDQGRLTPVKDQGDCGACWSFATYGSLESWLLTNDEGDWDFSEKNLIECHGFDWNPCYGGNMFMSTSYLARRSGPVSEADDPYVDYESGCTSGLPVRKYVEDVYMPPSVGGPEDNSALKQAVMDFGAVSTSMYSHESYYNSSDYTYYYSGTNAINHAVAIIGWDDGKSVPGAPGDGAWIVRNSWGTSFGEDGYFYISYYDSKVGLYNAAFIHAEEPDDTKLYEYDPLGWVTDLGFESTTAWGANVFTANSTGQLTAVSTYATDVNTSYDIYVSDEDSGSLVRKKSGTFNYPGYHTVDLSSPTSLEPGETFTVAIRYQTSGYTHPLPAECRVSDYSSAATASSGQSYVSPDGSSWSDLTTLEGGSTCNINIKATVTTGGPNPPSNLTATSVSSSQIDLSWQDNSSDETGFKVYRDGTQIDTVGSDVTSYQDDGLSEDTEYCYSVSAYNGDGESGQSNQACATTSGEASLTK
ncbi:MAG: lectin like domain-containing protein, partial [Candidatus Acetothermia bacterium]